jgi:hypothetical protein
MKRVLADDPLNEYCCGMRFPTNHKLYENFNKVIQKLHEAGIINHMIDKYKKYLDPKYYEKPVKIHKQYLETTYSNSFENGPQVLTLSDLEFGFMIWLGTLVLPFVAFFFEFLFESFLRVKERCLENVRKRKTQKELKSFNQRVKCTKKLESLEMFKILKTLDQNEIV